MATVTGPSGDRDWRLQSRGASFAVDPVQIDPLGFNPEQPRDDRPDQ